MITVMLLVCLVRDTIGENTREKHLRAKLLQCSEYCQPKGKLTVLITICNTHSIDLKVLS